MRDDAQCCPSTLISGGLIGHPMVVGAPHRHRDRRLRLLQQAGGNPGHGRLMRCHTVPHLDDCPTSRIVVLDEPLARPAARSVKDTGNDRTKKVAERRGLVRWAWHSFMRVIAMSIYRDKEAA